MTDTNRTAITIASIIYRQAAEADFVPNDEVDELSRLHDFCDANVVFFAPAFKEVVGHDLSVSDEDDMALINEALDIANDWILDEGLAVPDYEGLVRDHEVEEAFEKFLGSA